MPLHIQWILSGLTEVSASPSVVLCLAMARKDTVFKWFQPLHPTLTCSGAIDVPASCSSNSDFPLWQ